MSITTPRDIAIRIKARAKEKKITLKTLQNEAGIGVNYINQMKNEGYIPSALIIAQIAKVLDCSTDFLLGMEENERQAVSYVDSEQELLRYFRKISDVQQQREIARLQLLAEQAEAERADRSKDNAAM